MVVSEEHGPCQSINPVYSSLKKRTVNLTEYVMTGKLTLNMLALENVINPTLNFL